MVYLTECLGLTARFYNLALVVVVLILYIVLLKLPQKKIFMKPWKLIFASLCVYVVEQILAALDGIGITSTPKILYPLFEFFIIILFIYALLTMKEYLNGEKK